MYYDYNFDFGGGGGGVPTGSGGVPPGGTTPSSQSGGIGAAASGGLQTFAGLFQTIFSGRKKAERNLNTIAGQTPTYAGSKPISNYYNEAFRRYNTSPTDSIFYKTQMNRINQNTATGLDALNTRGARGAGVAGVSNLVAGANDASLKADVGATQQQNQEFGQLGEATGMKNADERFKFQTNTIDPYQLKLTLAGMKAKAANDRYNAGLQNTFSGLSNLGQALNPATLAAL